MRVRTFGLKYDFHMQHKVMELVLNFTFSKLSEMTVSFYLQGIVILVRSN